MEQLNSSKSGNLNPLVRVSRLPSGKNRRGEGGKRLSGSPKHSTPELPLISIITAVYNGDAHLEETILSVINQRYPNLEFIVIDGGSTDRTLEIIQKYSDKIDYWVSESDEGISDAFNKGILVSGGDYLNFQGDGDGFTRVDALAVVANTSVKESIPMLIATRIERVDVNGQHLFFSPTMSPSKLTLLFRMAFPHQGLYTHFKMFEKYGLFDKKTIFSMDYEHLLRAYHDFPKVAVINEITARWRADGLGNGKTVEILNEYNLIKLKHKITNSFFLAGLHRWSFLKYYIKQKLGLE